VQGHDRYGSLTAKQAPWVAKLVARVAQPDLPIERPTTATADMSGVIALFNKAKQHLKFPAIVLSVPGFDTVRITVATQRARVPGSINVASHEHYDGDNKRVWYGRVHPDGRYEPTARVGTDIDAIKKRLVEFACDPAKVAGEHGRLTGRCCFCNLPLKDERSTAVGYGATCAKHYGLAWGKRPAQLGEAA